MQKIYQIIRIFLLSYLALSCAKKSSSNESAEAAKTSQTTNTATGAGGMSGLEALLGGLMGKGAGAGGGELPPEEAAAAADPNSVLWSQRYGASQTTGTALPFMSFQIYDAQKNYLDPLTSEDVYECPGDSLLIGFRALYDVAKGDRQMQPYCQFYEDGTGRPMVKKKCRNVSAFSAAVNTQKPFMCPANTFVAGFKGTWDSGKMDRNYSFQCCELANQEGTQISFLQTTDAASNSTTTVCETPPSGGPTVAQANHFQGVLDYQCEGAIYNLQTGQGAYAGTVIQAITTSFITQKSIDLPPVITNDRIWNFKCCALGVPTKN